MPHLSECAEYTLRVVYLRWLLNQKPATRHSHIESSRRSHDGSSTFFALDVGSLLGRETGRSSKYPERLLKLLDTTLQRIAMGQDSKFRRTVALFWSSNWADKTMQRQMKESRSLEEMILAFASTATKSLKKEEELADGAWKTHLDTQIVLFIDIIADNMVASGSFPNDLRERIESYKSKLQSGSASSTQQTQPTTTLRNIHITLESSLELVAQTFDIDAATLSEEIPRLQAFCTVPAAIEDLKLCLQRLNTDSPFPYSPTDYTDAAAWASYKTQEISNLSQVMLTMVQTDPSLAASSDASNVKDLTNSILSLRLDGPIKAFTFIPNDPRAAYRELLSACLEHDLEALKTLPEDQDVSLGILSLDHINMLSECAIRWRLPLTFRSWVFFEAIQEKYEQGQVPPDCVMEAVKVIGKISQEIPVSFWATSDRHGLENTILRRNVFFLSDVQTTLSTHGFKSIEFSDAVNTFIQLDILDPEHTALRATTIAIIDLLRQQAYQDYIQEASDRFMHEGGKSRQFAFGLADWIEKTIKRLSRRFEKPLVPQIDVIALVLHQFLSLWMRDLEDTMARAADPSQVEDDIEEALSIYRRAKRLLAMGQAFNILFEAFVRGWLDQTALKTKQWTDNALAVDNFNPTIANGPSSSVTDLFVSFQSAISFISELDWEDETQFADFACRLAKIISLSISDYCSKTEQLFSLDMQQKDTVQNSAKRQAWIEKAKNTIAHLQGEKKIQPFFNFTPSSCVKLNNIESARQQLDKLYQEMGVDDLMPPETSEKPTATQTYLFTLKVVLAEGLVLDGGTRAPDAFIVISDEHGNRYAKTRTIYEDSDPRWDETFDIPVSGLAWFMITVRHRNLAGKHDVLGRSYLCLDPVEYTNLVSKDLLLSLDTVGQVLIRVSMENERDDVQFHFGRAFRWLKRTESEMVRLFVDKMTPVLRQSLSRASIKSLLKPGGLDYNDAIRFKNDAIGKLSAAYRNALGSKETDYSIPLPPDTLKPITSIKRGLTDAEIESAIHPLFDYLDTNIHTLASTLSSDSMQMVMTKLWKQILLTIEGLIVPPLSDKPSNMRALSDGELDIALRWLKFLRDFLYAGGDPSGVPLNILQNAKFNEIMSVRIYYDWTTDDLMEECIRGFQDTIKIKAMKPSKSIMQQRNLGTIRARKSAKRALSQSGNHTEMIMRILRMRHGTQDFLAQQIQTVTAVRLLENNRGSRRTIDRRFR